MRVRQDLGAIAWGYAWAFLEPALQVAVIVMIIGLRPSTRLIPGIDYPVFLITTIAPFFMFRNIILGLLHAIESNQQLYAYRRVIPFDALFARWLLELALGAVVLVILLFAASMLGLRGSGL